MTLEPIKFYTFSEIAKLVEKNRSQSTPRIFNFYAQWNAAKEEWQVGYSTKDYKLCRIGLKEGRKERVFSHLRGVESFMRSVGVTEFKVIL